METPEFSQTGYYDAKNGDHFVVDDLLDFPNDENMVAADDEMETGITGNSIDTAADNSCNSSFSAGSVAAEPQYHHGAEIGGSRGLTDGQFGGELCVPYDDLAELEWLSNIVEESFSNEDLQKLQLIQGMKARTTEPSNTHQYHFQSDPTRHHGPPIRSEMSVPAKARSKRSRAAPGNWTSRLLVVSPTPTPTPTPNAPSSMSSSSESDITTGKKSLPRKKDGPDHSSGGDGRKCLHCQTDKTPQWRTGPMGPKTLCNACGVRYKSGRLVPEYRPAASPTFVLTKHSNSHRKVLELRRQKDMQRAHQHQQHFMHHQHQSMMFDHVSSNNGDDYLIHQHIGPDFRQLI